MINTSIGVKTVDFVQVVFGLIAALKISATWLIRAIRASNAIRAIRANRAIRAIRTIFVININYQEIWI